MHLFLACFWIAIALGIFFWPHIMPQQGLVQPEPSTRMPVAFFALFLAGYNLVRWRLARARRRRAREEDMARRPVRPRVSEEPPNPDFDFSDVKKEEQNP